MQGKTQLKVLNKDNCLIPGSLWRYVFLLNRVSQGDYPSKQEIATNIEQEFILRKSLKVSISTRTIERDVNDLRRYLGITIAYDSVNVGYFIPDAEVVGEELNLVLDSLIASSETMVDNYIKE